MHPPLIVCLLLLMLAVHTAAAQPASEIVRVRLFEHQEPQKLEIRVPHGEAQLFASDSPHPVAVLAASTPALVTRRGREVRVEAGEQVFFALTLRVEPRRTALLDVQVTDGKGLASGSYVGTLSVGAEQDILRIVNRVPLADYVASVVSHEYGFEDLEGNKAQAVLARTYALRAMRQQRPDYDLVDHVGAQVYRGAAKLNPAALEAVRLTQGETLRYNGSLAEAVYFASSGGHTADNDAVWQRAPSIPYLRGKADPYDRVSPHQNWQAVFARPRLLHVLSETYRTNVTGFLLDGYSTDGRVRQIRLLGPQERTIPSNEFRAVVNRHFGETALRSTFFDARRDGERYVFEGKGYGHGVGLSQWGAHAMAEQGYDYRAILGFYYAGVTLHPSGEVLAHEPQGGGQVTSGSSPPVVSASATMPPEHRRERHATPPAPSGTKRRVGW